MHAEGFDLETFSYDYHIIGLRFELKASRNSSEINNDFIDITHAGQRSSFALDIFKRKPGDRARHREFCEPHSDANLTGFIQQCGGKVAIRMLSPEEKQKLEKLKSEFKSKTSCFD